MSNGATDTATSRAKNVEMDKMVTMDYQPGHHMKTDLFQVIEIVMEMI